ncbi:hypothetical protein KTH44_16185 [Acinetobacter bereziniae]|uniref:hypothetical protein n=1 Tax=Acinetobacter bereziniae TaxID=106648 RepID=UPI0021CD716C|nr:hypothetical protein [Acinetobacter bereziniae]MCU4320657.1 hypothetical protein [Acinetobacter bereziniae]
MQMTKFYEKYGKEVVAKILDNAPSDADQFVYAYVAKSIDYLKSDDEQLMIWCQAKKKWKAVHPTVIGSFSDIAYSLSKLKQARKNLNLIDRYGGLINAKKHLEKLAYRCANGGLLATRNQYMELLRAIHRVEKDKEK